MTGTARPDGGLDVLLAGLLFADIVMTGLTGPPTPGVEVWTKDGGVSPGGIANIAVTCRRLGLRTGVATVAGHDVLGRYCWDFLDRAGIDLRWSKCLEDWRTPITVALDYSGDRALVTCGDEPPLNQDELLPQPPEAAAAFVHLDERPWAWVAAAHRRGTLVFADVGWDPTQRWDRAILDRLDTCHAFVPNEHEAMAYTRTSTPEAALSALAELVPFAVVTLGAQGAMAIDATTGESAQVPGIDVRAVDSTGAGDAFGGGLIVGTLAGWPLAERLCFATLVAGLSVRGIGGANSAPGWAEVAQWWAGVRRQPGLVSSYGFLDEVIPLRT